MTDRESAMAVIREWKLNRPHTKDDSHGIMEPMCCPNCGFSLYEGTNAEKIRLRNELEPLQ